MTRKTKKTATAETVRDNIAYAAARPVLSVLVPFLRDDPLALLEALDQEADITQGAVEVVLLDDGSADAALAARVDAGVARAKLPVRVVRLTENEGRARGRNRLATHARADVFLFLDADMRPDNRRFLQAWLDVIALDDPAVAFGGFSLKHASRESAFAVHRAMAEKAECVPWYERARAPEKFVYTSNLLVRRDAFQAEAFDRDFAGWGWEDVEWGMRVARRFSVRHVDIPATHLGLDTVESLAAKYESSVGNFARVVSRHPEVVRGYPSYRAAQLLKKAPALPAWRPLLKRAALARLLPTAARAFSLRLYRAALYAEAV
ncbi:glycosyltransferase family 2 protein [Caulobacter sp. 17J80-11]|uniref:glycosyltransferase family 2 protein n=1 Tax=Caulobacter sp. 17J80-11 TaxID=2763502 RepID=UPI0016539ED3|nr:glycosyltransferase family 2 protein [Caulobacter sp. 17J80-11]MBC6981918.1 glycosyltransferase family 2 protein [Caulobacter sp. 17J80-11]